VAIYGRVPPLERDHREHAQDIAFEARLPELRGADAVDGGSANRFLGRARARAPTKCVARRAESLSSVRRGLAGAEIRWARSTAAARESILRARARARGPRRTAARRAVDALRSRRAGGRWKITSANAPPARLVTTLIQWSSAWPANACAGAVDGLMSRGRVAARGRARGAGAATYVGQDLGHAPGPA